MTLTNVYTPDEVLIWFVLRSDGMSLDVWAYDDVDEIGERPEWLDYEVDQVGWESLLCGLGLDSPLRIVDAALCLGVAPEQPFCAMIDLPVYVTHQTDYGPEHDVEYGSDLVAIDPWSPERAADAWEAFLAEREECRAATESAHQEATAKRRADVAAMYLVYRPYFAPGQSTWDEMAAPAGLEAALVSQHGAGASWPLLTARCDSGDHRKAHAALWAEVQAELPHVTAEQFAKMPTRSW